MENQYFAKMNVMARLLGVSTQMMYRLIKSGKLKEGKHFSRFTANGCVMFYVPEVIFELKPANARLYKAIEEA
jgi:hypothetical protein